MPISPLITSSLPSLTPGPHKQIGYAYLRTLPYHSYTRPAPQYEGKPVFNLADVSYAVYYPCKAPRVGWFSGEGRVGWMPDPVGEMTKGYERFLGQRGLSVIFQTLRLVVGRIKLPAFVNAPLEQPPSGQYPLVIFSHGLAGTRNLYSQICSSLASQGYVVLAIEHKDGSAPAVVIPEDKILQYVRYEEVSWEGDKKPSLEGFRTLQLNHRVREIYEAYYTFRTTLSDEKKEGLTIHGADEAKRTEWTESFRGQVKFDELSLNGHSFGGGTMLHLLQTPPPDPAYTKLPIKNAIALDPWLDPIPMPSSSTSGHPSMPPILVINSQSFTNWSTHFNRLVKLCKEAKAGLMTLFGSDHQSFCDLNLLMPTGPAHATTLLGTISQVSDAFMRGDVTQSPSVSGKSPDNGKFERGEDGKLAGKDNEMVVHLLPEQ